MKNTLLNLETLTTMLNVDYTRAPAITTFATNQSLYALEFEKKVCRSAFKKEFGGYLPGEPADVRVCVGRLNDGPTLNSSRWSPARVKTLEQYNQSAFNPKVAFDAEVDVTQQNNKQFLYSGLVLFSADWLLELVKHQISPKRSVRAVINTNIRDISGLLNKMQSSSPVVGVRITATGRLGKRKKGMAQQMTKSIGKVPLGNFSQKVDYSQGFVVTKLGHVGLKVWIAYQ